MKLVLLALLLACACGAGARPLSRLGLRCNDPLAALRIDGAPAGTAGDYAGKKLSLQPGYHRLELRAASGEVAVREALLGAGDDVALVVTLGLAGQETQARVLDKGGAR